MANIVIDTNIMLDGFEEILENEYNVGIIIPIFVTQELDKLKTKDGEVGYLARKAVKKLYEIKKYGNLTDWVKLENNISIKVSTEYTSELELDYDCKDDFIIATTHYHSGAILYTNDISMCIKAEILGIKTKQINFRKDLYKNVYSGYEEVEVDDSIISEFYNSGRIGIDKVPIIPYENQFIILKSKYNPKLKGITICINNELQSCKFLKEKPFGIEPRNLEQKLAIELLMRNDIPMVSFTGQYGSSKSFLQLGVAMSKVLKGEYRKILLVKPPMPLDKNLMVGYKKGDLFSKYLNTLGSITSNLEALKDNPNDKSVNGVQLLEGYIDQGLMEIISVEDILGSSYNNCIIIAEEMQLLTKENMEALLSRVGSSRIFINGDLKQGSRLVQKDPRQMGLFHMIDVFKDCNLSGHLTLKSIQRSEFVQELSERW